VRRVEELLQLAQTQFRAGERDAASHTLVEAAQAYDTLGQHDSAATIYRSLGKSTHAGREVMLLWLQNCELRRDLGEAAQVACELGDRALNDGDEGSARTWFEKAIAFDASNTVAHRRLQRLGGHVGGIAVATPHAGPAAAPAQPVEVGRVEVAVGRGEAVTFDLGSLVAEFQRGVEVQLGGDPQGHYDLGMTYREMGLLEQAIEAFRTSQRHAGFEQRCGEMIGRCLLDQGCFDEAAAEFDTALRVNGASREMAADLKFQLGLAHEAAGRSREAIDAFEEVYGLQPNYPDIAMKIRVLRSGLEGS
jgi:tetratricopeptide (TPR) repeat protein